MEKIAKKKLLHCQCKAGGVRSVGVLLSMSEATQLQHKQVYSFAHYTEELLLYAEKNQAG